VDLVRVWPWAGARVLDVRELELADGFRRCRDVVIGGRERSCFTGSVLAVEEVLDTRFDDDRCKPPVVGLLILDLGAGGRIAELSFALGGLPDIDNGLEGLTVGSRLGDCALLGILLESSGCVFASMGSAVDRPYLLVPFSPGLRSDRVREGSADIYFWGFVVC